MPPQDVAAAAAEAKKRKVKGWVFTLSPPSYAAILRFCSDRRVRRKFFLANTAIATRGALDNRPVILRILRLRQERAKLLGFKRYADLALADRMAGSVREVEKLLDAFVPKARTRARRDIRELTRFAGIGRLEWWDLSYVGEQYRKDAFRLDERKLKSYFSAERMIDGMFFTARRLFGVTFRKMPDASPDVRRYEARLEGKRIGYLLLDLFARPTKRGGAWSASLRESVYRSGTLSTHPVAINVASFGRAHGKTPALLQHIEAVTLFHEFGHALHSLLTRVPHRNLDANRVEWDFIELPSQLMENWCWEEQPLRRFARHVTSGLPLPDETLRQLRRSRQFLQGFQGHSQAEFATLDMMLHTRRPPRTVRELDALCANVARRFAVLPVPPGYRRYASFMHVFAGGYAAGYYGYLWAEALEADAFERFEKSGLFDRRLGERYRREILAAGATRPGMESFAAFMGRKPDPQALFRKRGLS